MALALELLSRITLNLAGMPPRRETLYGREFIIVPATILVEGVLNGNRGPLYYPHQEIARSASSWNYTPLVYNHPKDPSTGQNISARSARVLDKDQFGYIFNARFERNSIKCEAWFDVESTKKIDSRHHTDVYPRIVSGKPIELSTGLFTDNEVANRGSSFNGKPYEYVARNYRPDHLAVLPTDIGACSVADGCGINVNQCSGDCDCEKCKDDDEEMVSENKLAEMPSDKACEIMQAKQVKGHKLTDQQRKMFAVICGDYKAWKKAKGQPTSNTLHSLFTVNQETTVAKKVDPRKEMIDEIIANCECQNEDDDRAVLNELNDDELRWTHEFVSNMATGGESTNNGMSVGKVAQRRLLNEMADEELDEERNRRRKAKNAAAKAEKNAEKLTKPDPDEEEEEEEIVGNAKITVNDLPVDMREDIEYARAMKQRERDSLIDRLTANVADPKAKATQRKRLQSRSLNDLRSDIELLPVANAEDAEDFGSPVYAGPGPVINQVRPAPPKPEPLGQPQWDWDQPVRTRAS
jgi:hypothetical protein